MKFLFDFFPVFFFFVVYKVTGDIYQATGILVGASIVQVGYTWIRYHKVQRSHLVSLVIGIVLGGATILFHDDTFIKWKPTVVFWIFAAVLLVSEFVGEKNLIRRSMEANFDMPTPIWRAVNFAWVIFLILIGFANLYVAFNFSQDFWVNFKLFGLTAINILFVILNFLLLSRYMIETPESNESQKSSQKE